MKDEIFLFILIDFCSKQLWRSISVCCECTVFCAKVRKKSHKLFPFTTDVPVCSDTQSCKVLLNQSCDSTGTGKTKINNETQLELVATLRWHAAFLVQGFVVRHCQLHGWEIAVILRNFRKTKLSKSNFFFFFFNSISTYIQCATRRLSLCDIRKYRFPAFYGTSDRQAAIFFWTRMIQTWSSFSLVDPCSIFFCSSVKPKLFTPTHAVGSLGWTMTQPGHQTLHQSHCQQLTDFRANYHSKWYSQRQLKSTDEKQEVLKKCWVELPWRLPSKNAVKWHDQFKDKDKAGSRLKGRMWPSPRIDIMTFRCFKRWRVRREFTLWSRLTFIACSGEPLQSTKVACSGEPLLSTKVAWSGIRVNRIRIYD